MRQEFQEIFNFTITIREVIANVLMATLCGVIISFFYTLTYRGVSYSIAFIKSVIMLSMITAFVMMVIGDNLARAFGMVGVISIIQFRSAMKGAQDFMFLYFALAMGLASGVGLYSVALVGTLMIGLITTILSKVDMGTSRRREFTLHITGNSFVDQDKKYDEAFDKYCKRFKQISSRVLVKDAEPIVKLSYHVSIKNGISSENFLNELKSVEGVREVNLQFEED
jgi:hypothetical protein